jgi:hypothetical protein
MDIKISTEDAPGCQIIHFCYKTQLKKRTLEPLGITELSFLMATSVLKKTDVSLIFVLFS